METIRYMASPHSLGGDFDLRKLKLSADHLSQADESINARLWELFPLDVMGFPDRLTGPDYTPKGPPFDVAVYAHEAARIEEGLLYCKARQLSVWWPYLTSELAVYLNALQRKRSAKVEPLAEVVRKVSAKKEKVNKLFENKHYKPALLGYMACLMGMMPWFASPIILTAQQCYDSGLAQLEASLWSNVYMAALKATDIPQTIKTSCLTAGSEGVHNMRYAPTSLLYKCRCRFIDLQSTDPDQQKFRASYDFDLIKTATAAMVDKNSKAWAHQHCVSEHVCFNQQFREQMRTWEHLFGPR